MNKPSVSFFCPAYNDEKNLPILIPKAIKNLRKYTSKFEIVIVEDGSPDKSGKVADDLASKFKGLIKVIHHKKNLGYGAALRSGFTHANRYDSVFYTDGDLQYDVGEIKKMLPFLRRFDVVIGYRIKRSLTLSRQIQTRIFNLIIRILFGLKVKDINCSMKIISRKSLNKIKLTSDGAFIDAELLIKLNKQGYKFKEVKVSHFQRKYGRASGGNFKVVSKTFMEIVSNFFNLK